MSGLNARLARGWMRLGPRFLPFADAASETLPLPRLLRLALFQVSVGMAVALLMGTLNRVMIVELGVSAAWVALMVALPLALAPLRALIGFRSDHHRSALGWRRVPYIWFGTLLQFGGLAIMPFALLLLGGGHAGVEALGPLAAGVAFILVGAGLHTTQTAGLALATDLAPASTRPRVVALLYVMLLLGTVVSALAFSLLLDPFTHVRLVQVVQGAALVTLGLNVLALWKQEARRPAARVDTRPSFRAAWREFLAHRRARRFLLTVGLGTAAFSMQEVLLEPYGAEVLGLAVASTTLLTAVLAGGTLAGFALAARVLGHGGDPCRLAAAGTVVGLGAFSAVVFAAPLHSTLLFQLGTLLIGFGGGLFAVGTLTAAMALDGRAGNGLVLGAWGAVHASAAGVAIALGGALRDGVAALAGRELLGPALSGPATAYGVVYHLEIALLFATLVAIGPLVGKAHRLTPAPATPFGLAEFPG